jgi:hypothetical protein
VDSGTVCHGGDSTCTDPARCEKTSKDYPFHDCPPAGFTDTYYIDIFIPDDTAPGSFEVFDGAGSALGTVCAGMTQTVTGADHPEITGSDPDSDPPNEPIPQGKHVYRITIKITGAGANGGQPDIPAAHGRVYWHT